MAEPQPSLDQLTAQLLALYAAAEYDLLAQAGRLVFGPRQVFEVAAQYELIARMRRVAYGLARELREEMPPLVDALIRTAAREGEAKAIDDLRRAVEHHPSLLPDFVNGAPTPGHWSTSAALIRLDLQSKLEDVTVRLTRLPDDVYRVATSNAAARLVGGGILTPKQAQQAAWQELTENGITGFVDRGGRNWSLSAYVEMAVRTSATRAFNASHEAQLSANGIDLFTVPGDGHPCPLCLPWENAILSRTARGPVERLHSIDERMVTVKVDATIAEATAAGLFHPNCRHTLAPYLPGVTQIGPRRTWTEDDERRYQATVRQRALEVEIRKAKRVIELGDPAKAAKAKQKLRDTQAALRAHVLEHDLVRRSHREQLDLGHKPAVVA